MQRLFDIKKTQIEMVRDRGYTISDSELAILTMNLHSFENYINDLITSHSKSNIRSLLSRSYTATLPDNTTKSMLVYYGGKNNPQQKQVSADVVRDFIGLIQKYGINEALLIVDAPLSSTGESELSSLTLTRTQVFFDHELVYNPTTHVDTPVHQLLSSEETQAKVRELKVDKSKLLILRFDDPIVRYYGWIPGNVVRVIRDDYNLSILSPKSINYRVIV